MASRFVPLTPRVGAKCLLGKDDVLHPKFADECRDALERYGVLLFPQISVTDDEQVTLSERMGEIIPMGVVQKDGTRDPLFKVSIDPAENPNSAEYIAATISWHVDGLLDDGVVVPPKATLLQAKRVPPKDQGGQTEFCSTYVAYDELSSADKEYCESLRVVHSLEATKRYVNPQATPEELARWRARRGDVVHPLVWQHQSGRKSLILGCTLDHIVGLPGHESRLYLDGLMARATRRENVYRHQWQVGDLVIWDNCGMLHRAIQYEMSTHRLMHRTTLRGEEKIKGVDRPR